MKILIRSQEKGEKKKNNNKKNKKNKKANRIIFLNQIKLFFQLCQPLHN